MWLLVAAALAAAPTKAPTSIDAGTGAIDGLQVFGDGRLVTGHGGGQAVFLWTDTWTVETAAPCDVTAVTALESTDVGDAEVYVGCGDGTVSVLEWADGEVAALTDDEGAERSYTIGEGSIVGLWADPDTAGIYALEDRDGTLYVHKIDDEGDVDDDGWGFSLLYDGYTDGVSHSGRLFVVHGGDDVTMITLASGTTVYSTTNLGVGAEDAAPSVHGGFMATDSTGYLAEYLVGEGGYSVVRSGLDDPSAVGVATFDDDEWLIVDQGGVAAVWDVEEGTLADEDPASSFDLPERVYDIAVASDGYAYGAGADGGIVVMTAHPWISDLSVTPDVAVQGSELTVTFTVDVGGDYTVRLNGDRLASGDAIATGTASDGETVTATITVDDTWAEGDNAVWVFHEGADGAVGRARATVTIDNPPDAPELTDANLGFADGALVLSFAGIDDEDLDHYTVYVSDAAFVADDWSTGGPSFEEGDFVAPIEVSAAGGEDVSVRLEPLTNYVTYYVAVRATDSGGLEGPMSTVIQGMPRPTFTAAELAGDDGGPATCTTGVGPASWAGALVALLAVRRRRAVALGALMFAAPAHAWEPERDLSPTRGDFEARYGFLGLDDANIQTVYGDSNHDLLLLEMGPQFFRVVEIDAGFGMLQDVAWAVDESGAESSERTMLTLLPLSLTGTARLHLLDEQLVVPYGSYGFDYILWTEASDDGLGGKDRVRGAKWGHHWALGGSLLLDVFAPSRASLLEASTGINDTFVTLEYRSQATRGGGLQFDGKGVFIGLKLDY